MVATRVAPLTTRIGLVPSVTVTHTEPFHISKAIATLDYVSAGRAGVRVQVSGRPYEARHFGRRSFPVDLADDNPAAAESPAADLLAEAADYVEVLRRLWDSWEDDAEVRDVSPGGSSTGRSSTTSTSGAGGSRSRNIHNSPSATGAAPGGRPGSLHPAVPVRLGQRRRRLRHSARCQRRPGVAEELAGLALEGGSEMAVTVLADVVVFLGSTAAEARSRKARLDELLSRTYRSDAAVFVGTLPSWPTCWKTGRSQKSRVPAPSGRIAPRPEADLRGARARAAAPLAVPHGLRLGHAAFRLGRSRPASRYTLAEVAT